MWGMGSVGWYRTYSDKWLEQGGITGVVAQDTYNSYTVTLLVPFVNTNYFVSLLQWDDGQTLGLSNATNGQSVHTKAVGSFLISSYSWTYKRMWSAQGYRN